MNSNDPIPPETTPVAPEGAVPPPLPEMAAPVEVPTPPPLPEEPVSAPAVEAPPRPAQAVPVLPPSPQTHELARIAQDFQIRRVQVEAAVQLLDEGNTVPFITRYRKERTGGLDEELIRKIALRVDALRALSERKQTILKSIAGQGKLTDPLLAAILEADHLKRLEDLYLPFKPKKKTLATEAREKGLEPAALAIWHRDEAVANLAEVLSGLINPDKKLATVEDVTTGIRHIISELINETAEVRGPIRLFLRDTAVLISNKTDGVPEGKGLEFRDYFQFKEPLRLIPPHRVLALNRGEHEKVLRTKLECDAQRAKHIAFDCLPLLDHPHKDFLIPAMEDAVDRLLLPSLEREVRREINEFAQDHAVDIFAKNLRSLLLKAPLGGQKVLAVDPGLRTGCKLAVLDETGQMLEEGVIFPHPPQKQTETSKRKLEQLIRKYQTKIVAIGNGTACRETEQVVSELISEFADRKLNPRPAASPVAPVTSETATPTAPVIEAAAPHPAPSIESATTLATPIAGLAETVVTSTAGEASTVDALPTSAAPAVTPPPLPPAIPVEVISFEGLPEPPDDVAYVIVNEAGASDYSASPIAKEEFPNLDATVRGTVSIGRRLQDPLAELVKVDPQHVGVGLYQHDIRPKYLKESLEAVVESCVNTVGVDVNTASVPLLRYVSGLNQLVAREIVEFRTKNGPFKSREQLKSVPQMGEARFTQSAGFLKIRNGDETLDQTWVHPESYPIAQQVLESLGHKTTDLKDNAKLGDIREKLKTQNPEAIANSHKVGGPTVRDIFEAISKPGRDVREDRPQPIFRKGVLNLEDLSPGMELKGEILNVVDFGAFVDVGLKDSGLIHISQMANRFIKSPYDLVNVGDVVRVWVNSVDSERRRVSLSMIPPGQERQPEPRRPDRPPGAERPERPERPPQQFPPRPPRPERPPMGDRPPQQQRGPVGPPRPPSERGGFAPRPATAPPSTTIPPPIKPGQGRPSGLYRGGVPALPPPPRRDAAPTGPVEGAEAGPIVPPKPKKGSPKLSDKQKGGRADLNTFSQLAAFFGPGAAPPPPPSEAKPEQPETPPPTDEPKSE